jgi:hypothetical protein
MSERFVLIDDVGVVIREYQENWQKWKDTGDPKHKEAWLRNSEQLRENLDWVILYARNLQGDIQCAKENLKLIRDAGMSANDARAVAERTLDELEPKTY